MHRNINQINIYKKFTALQYGTCFLALAVFFSSCKVPQNAYYFKTAPKDMTIASLSSKGEDLKIKKNDLLMINTSSLNREEDQIYNAPAVSVGSVTGAGPTIGYLVDGEGNIQYHRLGVLHVDGMTRAILKEKIQKDLSPYLKDPVVTIRFLNHNITVLGEVTKPQVLPLPEERLSLLEALGSSGDVTPFARRNNILVIRETDKGNELKRINLEDQSIFTSPWYWLQPGDVVYVEPNDIKVNEEKRAIKQQTISIALSALTIAVVILSRVIK